MKNDNDLMSEQAIQSPMLEYLSIYCSIYVLYCTNLLFGKFYTVI